MMARKQRRLTVYHECGSGGPDNGLQARWRFSGDLSHGASDVIDDVGSWTRMVPVGTDLIVKFQVNCAAPGKAMFSLLVEQCCPAKMLSVALRKSDMMPAF